MIRLYLVAWARSGAQIVNPVVDGVETIGQPASCSIVVAPSQQDGSPNKGHFVVLVDAAANYPWATLASVSGAKLLPEIDYTKPLTRQQESAIQRQLDDYGLTLPVGVSAASAFEAVAKQVHPDAKIADRLKGIVRPLAPSGTFTDDFTEASTDTNLESHTPSGGTAWTRVDGAAGGAVVQASSDTLRVRSTTTTAYTCDDQGTADHYTQARNKTLSSGRSNSYVCVRLVDKDNFLGWRLAGSGATGSRLSKCVAGTVTDLVTFQGVDESVYRVEVSGSDAEIFEDGVSKGTGTYSENTTETSQGVRSGDSSADPWIDDFEAGALSGGTTDGVGSSAGSATAAAVGASTAAADGTSAGSATAAGVGASTAEAAGAAAGSATVSGVGASTAEAVGTAAGSATASAVGASTAAAAGTSAGTSTASAVGEQVGGTQEAVGTSAGSSTAAAVGASTAAGAGSSAGVATASAVGVDASAETPESASLAGLRVHAAREMPLFFSMRSTRRRTSRASWPTLRAA